MHKYKKTNQEGNIITKIDELNKKYLGFNKEYFELKQKKGNAIGPNEFQLCEEIHDLEKDLFSYNNSRLMDIKSILKEEITKDEWNDFINKINYCKNIKYETKHIF